MKSFTLLEVLVVIIIIGIVSTLSVTQYTVFREKGYDHAAKSNVELIAEAQKVLFMETNAYTNAATTADINSKLHLNIKLESAPVWNYTVAVNTGNTSFAVQAERTLGGYLRYWCMNSTNVAPLYSNTTCPSP